MAEYEKELVSRDGKTVISHSPTETVDLTARGYAEVEAKSKPSAAPPKASPPSLPKAEGVTS